MHYIFFLNKKTNNNLLAIHNTCIKHSLVVFAQNDKAVQLLTVWLFNSVKNWRDDDVTWRDGLFLNIRDPCREIRLGKGMLSSCKQRNARELDAYKFIPLRNKAGKWGRYAKCKCTTHTHTPLHVSPQSMFIFKVQACQLCDWHVKTWTREFAAFRAIWSRNQTIMRTSVGICWQVRSTYGSGMVASSRWWSRAVRMLRVQSVVTQKRIAAAQRLRSVWIFPL